MTAEIIYPTEPVMTHADRCDSCGARAWVGVMVNMEDRSTLRFCGHHYARHELRLRVVAAFIVDERYRINARPSPSGSADGKGVRKAGERPW